MDMVFRKGKSKFFLFFSVGVLLFILAITTGIKVFFIHYYFIIISLVYYCLSFVKKISLNDTGIKMFYGFSNRNTIEVCWDDVSKAMLIECDYKIRSSRGGRISIPFIETVKQNCVRIQLNKSIEKILDKTFYDLPPDMEVDKSEKTIKIFTTVQFGKNLISAIDNFKDTETKIQKSSSSDIFDFIKALLSLCFLSTLTIGILTLLFK